jgi:hypothetical protein
MYIYIKIDRFNMMIVPPPFSFVTTLRFMKLIRVFPLFTVSHLLNANVLLPYNAEFTDLSLTIASQIVDLLLTLTVW